jgi:hypothetical protein
MPSAEIATNFRSRCGDTLRTARGEDDACAAVRLASAGHAKTTRHAAHPSGIDSNGSLRGATLGTGCILISSMLVSSAILDRPVIQELLITLFEIRERAGGPD